MSTTKTIEAFDPAAMRADGAAPGWALDADGLIHHPGLGIRMMHVMMLDDGRVLHDRVLVAERGGGVFVPVDGRGRVGLQRMWRPQARDQDQYAASFPDIDLSGLGRISYEFPRGFGERGESGRAAAIREAEEETRGKVAETATLGPICSNTGLFPHAATAVWGRVNLGGAAAENAAEGIVGGLEFFSRRGLADLQRDGLLYDGFTLAAITLLWIRHPEILGDPGTG